MANDTGFLDQGRKSEQLEMTSRFGPAGYQHNRCCLALPRRHNCRTGGFLTTRTIRQLKQKISAEFQSLFPLSAFHCGEKGHSGKLIHEGERKKRYLEAGSRNILPFSESCVNNRQNNFKIQKSSFLAAINTCTCFGLDDKKERSNWHKNCSLLYFMSGSCQLSWLAINLRSATEIEQH